MNVTALAGQQSYPVIRERRIPAAELWADWDVPDVDWVVVKVYHHLRPAPVIARWQTGHWQSPTMQLEVPEAFRVPRSLYFRHPGGRRLELCDAPGQRLELEERTLQGEVSHATVSSSTAH